MNHDFHTCPNCEMTYAAFATCFGCLSGKACESPERCDTPNLHTCPVPYDIETARYLLNMSTGHRAIPISMRQKGRVVVALKAAQN